MRTIRFLAPLVAAAVGLIFLPSVADAATYPVGSPQLTVEFSTVNVGDSDRVFGSGFAPDEPVVIDVVYAAAIRPAGGTLVPVAYRVPDRAAAPVANVVADGTGAFTVSLVLDQVGLATITATGPTSGSATATVRILAAGASLPVTGQSGSALRIGLIGSAVAAFGVVLLVLVRSRRRRVGAHHN